VANKLIFSDGDKHRLTPLCVSAILARLNVTRDLLTVLVSTAPNLHVCSKYALFNVLLIRQPTVMSISMYRKRPLA